MALRKVLVTGATGFVGSALCRALIERGYPVRRALRSAHPVTPGEEDVVVGELGPDTLWNEALRDVDSVVHLAARTHVMRDIAADPLAEYRRINVDGTRALVKAAGTAGVRRFVFLSSIKVNGEETGERPFTEDDTPQPQDAYGISKREAELALAKSAAETGTETVVLRPPLLYGPGVKGNFLKLMRAIDRGVPLPLGSIRNRRSLLYVDHLVDAIVACLDHPAAARKTYLLADDGGVSTPDLVHAIADAMNKPARLLLVSPALLKLAGVIVAKRAAVSRLTGSLQIDSSRIRRDLAWQPRYSMPEGLRRTAEWYYQQLATDPRN
jgi:nucleoside-diphosphate-sugar epimerase